MSDKLLVATRKGLFTIDRKGKPSSPRWEITAAAFLGSPVTLALPDARDGSLYAALEHAHFGPKLHRSADGGQTWQEVGVPVYPTPGPGEEAFDAFRNVYIRWKLDRIWALEPADPGAPGTLWCGTIPGGLFRSADHGTTWELIEPLWRNPKRMEWFGGGAERPGIHSVCVHPRDPKHVTVGVSCGGVWQTTDGGATWSCRADGMRAAYMPPERASDPNIQDPHRVVQCPARPECLWAQHHNGVFRTTDGCDSWHEIEDIPPSVFGFAVAVHPRDPETAWFVPGVKDEVRIPVEGKVVVTRTRDGGKTFDVLREGLPQHHAYDLVFRHALDIDSTGDRLAFGSTTGSLWVSENQGDSWDTISVHLPPVYAMRFVS